MLLRPRNCKTYASKMGHGYHGFSRIFTDKYERKSAKIRLIRVAEGVQNIRVPSPRCSVAKWIKDKQMNYQLKFLEENDISEVHRAFMEAFSDYVQSISHVTETYIRNRAILNGVDFGCSVGAYDQGTMVGFLLAALDDYFGEFAAYDL